MSAAHPGTTGTPPHLDPPSDHALLRSFRQGDEQAAAELYHRYAARLHDLIRSRCPPDLARRVDAEDILQSVFSSFFRRARRGDYDVPAGEELWGLLLVIGLNKLRAQGNFHRAGKRDVGLTAAPRDGAPARAEDGIARTFLRLVLEDLLGRLPEPRREMVRLRIEGYEVAEIALRTGRAKRTVERVLQGFRAELAAALAGD